MKGSFGLPALEEAAGAFLSRSMVRRVGVIDVGSNSVRMVVFDGVARAPAYFFNEKVLCGLGRGLEATGRLDPEGVERALRALHRFAAIARQLGLNRLDGVATAAVRDATDGPEFCARVEAETGLSLRVITGAEEAKLAAKGVLIGWPRASGLVCDLGGASMELALVRKGQIGACATAPIGPLRLSALPSLDDAMRAIHAGVGSLARTVKPGPRRIFLVGGSWRAIAKLDMERRGYPMRVLHEYRVPTHQLLETCRWAAAMNGSDLTDYTDTSLARLELVPLAARILPELARVFAPETFSISSYGLREGLLYDLMPEDLRARDPLLEVARHMEHERSRFPGFGDKLYQWIRPLVQHRGTREHRLIHAACLLHDIGWRTHPDYRAELCFDMVTRANISGLDHAGRIFLGIAVMHRYKSGAVSGFDPELLGLLDEVHRRDAEVLGRALRLGAMLGATLPGALDHATLSVKDGSLVLTLRGPGSELDGEPVERRLASLAAVLELEPKLVRRTEMVSVTAI